jgi:signal transduction histidine kinase/ActR/RegA family two-component response regulator
MMPPSSDELRVLIKAVTSKDAALAKAVLASAALPSKECLTMEGLAAELREGAGALLIAEEFLTVPEFSEIVAILGSQPPWSDLPVLILARTGADSTAINLAMEMPANFAVIERPVRIASLVSAVKVALRARGRQYELRKIMEGLRLADRRKTEFLATLAHELRNPLAPLTNAIAILQMGRLDAAGATRYYTMMERQVRHMTRLIDDLMEVSRITRGKIDFKWGEVAIDDVVRDAVDLSQPFMDAASHDLKVRILERGLRLRGDRVRLTQVLANILNNAAKYTPRSGNIVLAVARRDGDAEIRVQDNGVGIPADMLSSIFEMFVQVSDASRAAQGGLGIGLTLVKSLVELHGGRVAAFSDGVGKGTEIVLTFPLLRQEQGVEKVAGIDAIEPLRRNILIVDDNQEAADSLADLLSKLGATTHVAYDGAQALIEIGQSRPSHAILDIGMSGMDGWELASRVREDESNDGIVLIALTGWGQAADRDRTLEAGFNHHLLKPVDLKQLLRILRENLSESSRL